MIFRVRGSFWQHLLSTSLRKAGGSVWEDAKGDRNLQGAEGGLASSRLQLRVRRKEEIKRCGLSEGRERASTGESMARRPVLCGLVSVRAGSLLPPDVFSHLLFDALRVLCHRIT